MSKRQTTPDDPVSRAVILSLAERAMRSGNTPLRDLLLLIAGMQREDGKVIDTEWKSYCTVDSPYSIGLMLANRHRYRADDEPVRGGLAALDEIACGQAHGWSYTAIGDMGLGLSEEVVFYLDEHTVSTAGELVALWRGADDAWRETGYAGEIRDALDRFRETLPTHQQEAFDKARKPSEPKVKKGKKVKEAS